MKFIHTLLVLLITVSLNAHSKETSKEQKIIADNFNKQVMCMAKNIYYESATESYEGKLAVAQVTMNRANTGGTFPTDVCSVVYQKTGTTCQFSWTCSKDLVGIRDHYAWEECLMIAKRAMTQGVLHMELAKSKALFYHAAYIQPGWNNIRVVRRIGNHIFYRRA